MLSKNEQDREYMNNLHSLTPEVGDYWHEMFSPYFLVVKVKLGKAENKYVILSCIEDKENGVKKAKVEGKDGWSFDYDKHSEVTQKWIYEKVTYSSSIGFVADVSVSDKWLKVVGEWAQHHRERLMKEMEEYL